MGNGSVPEMEAGRSKGRCCCWVDTGTQTPLRLVPMRARSRILSHSALHPLPAFSSHGSPVF